MSGNGEFDVDAEIARLEERVRKLRRYNRLRRIVEASESKHTGVKDSTFKPILDLVCTQFHVSEEQLLGRDRHGQVAWARHVTAYLLRQLTSNSSLDIGRLMGKHHASILNSVSAVMDRMETDHTFAATVHAIHDEAKEVIDRIL